MEILISLWSYDNRWVFQKEFKKSTWYMISTLTFLLGASSALMCTFTPSLYGWVGFRVLICIVSSLTSLILGINHDSPKQQKKLQYLVLFLVFLGFINISSMYSFQDQIDPDWKLTALARFQFICYYYPILHILGVISCFFIIKLFVLCLAFTKPSYLVKIRNKV